MVLKRVIAIIKKNYVWGSFKNVMEQEQNRQASI